MLSIVTQEVTMSSIDFLNDYINPARHAYGQPLIENYAFNRKLVDELDLIEADFSSGLTASGQKAKIVDLSYKQMMLIGMRESKAVRRTVLDRLDELQKPKEDPIVLLAQKVLQQDAEIKHLEKTKAQINDKRTATIMGRLGNATKTIKKLEDQLQDVGTYQSLTASKIPARVDTEMKNNVQSWRLLKQLSSDIQLPPKKVKCERYGEVLAYHVDVIELFKSKYLDSFR